MRDVLHALGILYAQQDNFTDAIACLEKAILQAPTNPIFGLHLANILKTQGLFSQAGQVLLNTLASHPHYAPALNNLGTVYYAQSKLADAVTYYQAAIAQQPDYVDAYYNLGLALTKQDQIDAAIQGVYHTVVVRTRACRGILSLSLFAYATRSH